MSLLEVTGLCLRAGTKDLVRDLSFTIAPGEILAVVGPSGAGKTLTALSILGLLPPGVTRAAGRIVLDGVETMQAAPKTLRSLRGGVAGMVFQEPGVSLNPLARAGAQVAEALTLHGGRASQAAVLERLSQAGFAAPERIAAAYPHTLSGGEKQRVMIAMALANSPKLLIADEPASALDPAAGAHILTLIVAEKARRGLGVLLITHDAALARQYADRVLEMGKVPVVPPILPPPPPADAPEILRARGISVRFGRREVLRDVSLTVREGETLGIVGPSGAGKSTLALAILQLIRYEGEVSFQGARLNRRMSATLRRRMQIIFQDPSGSLPPRMTVGEIVGEGLAIHERGLTAAARQQRVAAALAAVGLDAEAVERDARAFSGGERQRIAIARALVLEPELLVLDEPTSALDGFSQSELLGLLRKLQVERGMAYVLISHDREVVGAMAHRVMELGASGTMSPLDLAEEAKSRGP